MLFERIITPGLAQYSYLIGDGVEAVVIDPRRDCEVYIEKALVADMRIAHILETHRHEDFAVGSLELAARTGAQLWHADAQLPYEYGEAVSDGQEWHIGSLRLLAIHTPGHTEGSMSYVLYTPNGVPWMVFTGDVLFTGEVGRVDFLGMVRAPELAGHLYDSIFDKLLPLGDGVLLCPGHGAGSACGSTIADRPWSTLGLERRLNPRLKNTEREDFVAKVVRKLPKPPYFARMEAWNLAGPPPLHYLPVPQALAPGELAAYVETTPGVQLVDVRDVVSFAGGHIPGVVSLPLEKLPIHIGWLLSYDKPMVLITGTHRPLDVVRHFVRQGFDDVVGYLAGGMHAWTAAGKPVERVGLVSAEELALYLDDWWVLDVRNDDEVRTGSVPRAHQIVLSELRERMAEIPRDTQIAVYCRSGPRSAMATGLLLQSGYRNVSILSGGIAAWQRMFGKDGD